MTFLFLSTGELFFVALVIVMLFGSKKIPDIARGLGKGIREFKNATSDIQEEIRKTGQEINQSAQSTKKEPSKHDSNTQKPDQN